MVEPDDESSIDEYIRNINQIPKLSAEDESLLVQSILAGDDKARRQLAEANLRLVVEIVARHAWRGFSMLDLVTEGNIAIFRAAEKFNPEKGHSFAEYAEIWIEQALKELIEK